MNDYICTSIIHYYSYYFPYPSISKHSSCLSAFSSKSPVIRPPNAPLRDAVNLAKSRGKKAPGEKISNISAGRWSDAKISSSRTTNAEPSARCTLARRGRRSAALTLNSLLVCKERVSSNPSCTDCIVMKSTDTLVLKKKIHINIRKKQKIKGKKREGEENVQIKVTESKHKSEPVFSKLKLIYTQKSNFSFENTGPVIDWSYLNVNIHL